jgi:hypothetical protein
MKPRKKNTLGQMTGVSYGTSSASGTLTALGQMSGTSKSTSSATAKGTRQADIDGPLIEQEVNRQVINLLRQAGKAAEAISPAKETAKETVNLGRRVLLEQAQYLRREDAAELAGLMCGRTYHVKTIDAWEAAGKIQKNKRGMIVVSSLLAHLADMAGEK